MECLSFMSLNIERDKHLELVIPFLEQAQADVVCLQEVFEADLPLFENACGGKAFFVPMNRLESPRGVLASGIAILSRLPLSETAIYRYAGTTGELGIFDKTTAETKLASQRFVVAFASVTRGEKVFRIATTHFPWTPGGQADDAQRAALKELFKVLAAESEFILCGDFNAPRGREIFSALSDTWKDNVPLRYESSLDGTIHRAGPLPYMVDGLFSTPVYQVSNVEMHCGVSDHCALLATIERK